LDDHEEVLVRIAACVCCVAALLVGALSLCYHDAETAAVAFFAAVVWAIVAALLDWDS
jgi:hypothetical protein